MYFFKDLKIVYFFFKDFIVVPPFYYFSSVTFTVQVKNANLVQQIVYCIFSLRRSYSLLLHFKVADKIGGKIIRILSLSTWDRPWNAECLYRELGRLEVSHFQHVVFCQLG